MKIAIIGGINIDIEGAPYKEIKYHDSNPGKIRLSYGGVGRNIAENVARLGGDCAMISCVGSEPMSLGAKDHLAAMGVDAETSGRNDILVGGKKVSGVAQRITNGRILHHGTLLFDSDPAMIEGALKADPAKFRSKSAKSVRSRVGNIRDYLPADADLAQFRERLLRELTQDGMLRETLTDEELAAVRKLAEEKYRSWEWTYGRSPDFEMKNRRRFPGGTLEVRMNTHEGRIQEIAFYGDYMAAAPNTALCEALRDVPLTRQALAETLAGFDIGALFGAITAKEITETILG